MKKLLLTMTAVAFCVAAYGQGKLLFLNDTLHAIYFTTDTTHLNTGDASYAGNGAYTTGGGGTAPISSLKGSPTFVAALYGGTSSSTLSLQTTTTIGNYNYEGLVNQVNALFASLPNLVTAYFQVQVFDSRAASGDTGVGGGAAAAWAVNGQYGGESSIFTAVPQTSVYSPIYQQTSPVFSTWANGTFNVEDYPGEKGAVMMYANVPEPTSMALAGLGLATLLIFRRRK